jgi:alpha-beta hydrolase superfamily lysophospholipase
MMRPASPLYMAEYVRAPVLLLHGAEDAMVLPEESRRMAERLTEHRPTVLRRERAPPADHQSLLATDAGRVERRTA